MGPDERATRRLRMGPVPAGDMITALLVVVAIVSGVIASLVGFGVGSLLTPALSLETGIKLAVAAASLA